MPNTRDPSSQFHPLSSETINGEEIKHPYQSEEDFVRFFYGKKQADEIMKKLEKFRVEEEK